MGIGQQKVKPPFTTLGKFKSLRFWGVGKTLAVTMVNPLAWERNEVVRIPVPFNAVAGMHLFQLLSGQQKVNTHVATHKLSMVC